MKCKLSTIATAAVLALACGIAAAQAKTVKLRLGHTLPDADSQHLAALEFAKRVKERTNGEVEITVFPNSVLGPDGSLVASVRSGTIDIGVTGNPFLTAVSANLNVLDLPYLFEDEQALAETAWLHEVHAQAGMPNAVVAYVDFGSPDAATALQQQAAFPLVRGIRCKPKTSPNATTSVRNQPGTMQDERWLSGLSLLERHGMSWDLRVPYWHLAEAADVAAQFPSLPIVVNHLGLPWDRSDEGLAAWRQGMEALAGHDNVHVKLSELGLRDAAWNTDENARLIREAVDIFGWQRCMFASNLPVSGLSVDMATLIETVSQGIAHLTDEARRAIWHDSALRFYRIAI